MRAEYVYPLSRQGRSCCRSSELRKAQKYVRVTGAAAAVAAAAVDVHEWRSAEPPGSFMVSLERVGEKFQEYMYVVFAAKNVRTAIKSGAALVLNEKLWCGVNTEKLPADPRRACVVSMRGKLPGTLHGYRELFARTFRTSSADPDDVTMSVHGEVARARRTVS